MDWNEIDNTPTTAQRRALYRFGIPRELVQNMTEIQAREMIRILCAAAQQAKRPTVVDHD